MFAVVCFLIVLILSINAISEENKNDFDNAMLYESQWEWG